MLTLGAFPLSSSGHKHYFSVMGKFSANGKVAKLILGSGSRTRKDILKEMGLDFEIKKADIDEKLIRRNAPEDLVMVLASEKANAIIKKLKAEGLNFPPGEPEHSLLITCDQVVVHDNQIREKPENESEARIFIRGYSKSPPRTVGSVMITNLNSGLQVSGIDSAEIHFDEIPPDVIDLLVREENTYHSAGGLMVEHPLVTPYVRKIIGTMDSVMGLPKELTLRLLHEALNGREQQ